MAISPRRVPETFAVRGPSRLWRARCQKSRQIVMAEVYFRTQLSGFLTAFLLSVTGDILLR